MRTAFISTYPPRRCGIATFSQALGVACGERVVVALQPPDQELPYPFEVAQRIRRDELTDYARVAAILNERVDAVSIQHAFDIWGGEDGSYVFDLIDALRVPAVATLHVVPGEPTARQRTTLTQLIDRVAATVVMCQSAATRLARDYGVDPQGLEVIHHGVPELPLVEPATIKPTLGLVGRDVILTYGLLSPAKGVELALEAMPAVVAAHPAALYVVLGPTHPDLVRETGEAYRETLVDRAAALGLGDHVRFMDRFAGRVELTRWLEAADIYLTPYPTSDQVVSGALSYAMGAGRAIVSTPFAYAADLLAEERGVLVPEGAPDALAAALTELLDDSERRAAIGRRAYDHSRPMLWPHIGTSYNRIFARVSSEAARIRASAPLRIAPA